MKGTATLTKTKTVRPVVVPEIKQGRVLSQSGRSVVIRQDNGTTHRFNQTEVDARGIQLFMGDKPIHVYDLKRGDQISARIVTAGPPEVLTKQQVDAILAQPAAPVAAAAPPAEEPAAATPEATAAPTPEAEPLAEAAPEIVAEEAPAPETMAATEPVEEKSKLWLWILLLIVLAVVAWLVTRNKKEKQK